MHEGLCFPNHQQKALHRLGERLFVDVKNFQWDLLTSRAEWALLATGNGDLLRVAVAGPYNGNFTGATFRGATAYLVAVRQMSWQGIDGNVDGMTVMANQNLLVGAAGLGCACGNRVGLG